RQLSGQRPDHRDELCATWHRDRDPGRRRDRRRLLEREPVLCRRKGEEVSVSLFRHFALRTAGAARLRLCYPASVADLRRFYDVAIIGGGNAALCAAIAARRAGAS